MGDDPERYECKSCMWEGPENAVKWTVEVGGQCPRCGEWESLSELPRPEPLEDDEGFINSAYREEQ